MKLIINTILYQFLWFSTHLCHFLKFCNFALITLTRHFQIIHAQWPKRNQKLWANVFPDFGGMQRAYRLGDRLINRCRRLNIFFLLLCCWQFLTACVRFPQLIVLLLRTEMENVSGRGRNGWSNFLHWFDEWTLDEQGKKQRQHECGIPEACYELMAVVPCTHRRSTMSQGKFRIVPKCLDIDRKVYQPISNVYLSFHGKWRHVFVGPSAGTE